MNQDDDWVSALAEVFGVQPTEMALFFGRDQLIGILDIVRDRILDWALQLWKAGIVGDGLSFSPQEKAAAKDPTNTYHIAIENFTGNLGTFTGNPAVIITNLNQAQVTEVRTLVAQLERLKGQMGLTETKETELSSHLEKLREETSKPEPDGGKVQGLLRSIKNIGEGMTGNVIASGVVHLISKLPWI